MGVDFNAEFSYLNTNKQSESANILDADECQAAQQQKSVWTLYEGMTAEQFKTENQHCAEQDANKDGVVTVQEQKAEITDQLKKVWTSRIARFFKDDISYDDSKENTATQVTNQVKARIQNALSYIQYAKDNKIDIFYDNEGTGVEDKDGELQEYTNGNGNNNVATKNPGVDKSVSNDDGTFTNIYKDGHTATWDDNCLKHSSTSVRGVKTDYKYNEDGSYTYVNSIEGGASWHMPVDKNNNNLNVDEKGNIHSGYFVTARGNYKAFALAGETVDQTLDRLGITGKAAAIVKLANPKACKSGSFKTDCPDVYIPKAAIDLMRENRTFDENALMGVQKKPEMGV